jgi:hypothetical protein
LRDLNIVGKINLWKKIHSLNITICVCILVCINNFLKNSNAKK